MTGQLPSPVSPHSVHQSVLKYVLPCQYRVVSSFAPSLPILTVGPEHFLLFVAWTQHPLGLEGRKAY